MIPELYNTKHVSLFITRSVNMGPVQKAAKLLKALSWLSSSSLAYPRHTSQPLNCQLTSQIPSSSSLLSTFGHSGWLADCPKVLSVAAAADLHTVAKKKKKQSCYLRTRSLQVRRQENSTITYKLHCRQKVVPQMNEAWFKLFGKP